MVLPRVEPELIYSHYEGPPEDLGRPEFVAAKIRQALGKLETRYGVRIKARLESGVLSKELYEDIVAEAVLRVLRNPEGLVSEEQGNYSYRNNSKVSSGYLMFTDDNIEDLIGSSLGVMGFYTLRV